MSWKHTGLTYDLHNLLYIRVMMVMGLVSSLLAITHLELISALCLHGPSVRWIHEEMNNVFGDEYKYPFLLRQEIEKYTTVDTIACVITF